MRSIAEQLPEQFNLAKFLYSSSIGANRGKKIAFYGPQNSITYASLFDHSMRFSEYLGSLGIDLKERIVILLPDSIEFIIGFLGAIWRGVIPVLINEAASVEDIAYMLADCQCSA